MVAKTKKQKVTPKVEEEEKVIEVKTTKKDTAKSSIEKGKEEKGEIKDLSEDAISSFSQLDSDKELPKEADKKEPELKKEIKEEKKEEKLLEEEPKEDVEEEEKKEEKPSIDTKEWIPSSDEVVEEKGSKSKLLIVFALLIIIGVIVGGFFYYKSSVQNKKTSDEPSAPQETEEVTPTPTEIPEETSTEEIDYSEYSVSILNGSGIPGEAGIVQGLLEELGFEDIDTGNAESYDYETTEISFKESVPGATFEGIQEVLGGEYTVKLTESTLDEDSSFDIIIIVGIKK